VRSEAKALSAVSNAREGTRARIALVAALALAALVTFVAFASAAPAAPENYASFGPDGTESSDFEWVTSVAVDQQTGVVYAYDYYAGALYKFEADGTPVNFTGSNPNIDGNEITGLSPASLRVGEAQVAVDSNSHVVYVTEEHAIRAFQADGTPANFTAGPGAGTNELPGLGEATGVAVDVNGAIYVSDFTGNAVNIYSPTGAFLTTSSVAEPRGLAVAPDGAIYVVKPLDDPNFKGSSVYKLDPSEFPVTTSTTYNSSLLYTNGAQSVGVDPLSGDVYVLKKFFTVSIEKFDKDGNFLGSIGGTEDDGELKDEAHGIAAVAGGEEFQLYVGNTEFSSVDPDYSKVAILGEEIVEGPPAIRSTSAIDVTADSATLRAQINPDTADTTYRFEYGPAPCSTSVCAVLPVTDGQIPAGHRFVSVSEQLLDLASDTTYHYRLVAENSFGTTEGPERTLITQAFGLGFELSDSRAWEMVTPTNKHGAKVAIPVIGQIAQAAEDGEGLVFPTLGSIASDPEGSRAIEGATVLSRRGPGGWHSVDLTPRHSEPTLITNAASEYQLFSSDLARGLALPADSTPLSPEASERTPYLRENTEPPIYTPLLTSKEGFANVPPGTEFGGGASRSAAYLQGATEDLSYVALKSDVPLIAGAPDFALYEWHAGELRAVGKLPVDEGGDWDAGSNLGSEQSSVRNAISADGSRVFWSHGHTGGFTALYLRDLDAEETVRLDVVQPGGSGLGESRPVFQGASADGTVVFFTDGQQLTEGASPEGADLYRCEIPAGESAAGCATLIDVSAPPVGPGESAKVLGIVSALSDDATKAYFAAEGELDSSPNSFGETAVPGEPNLYRWQEGEGLRFIATLSDADSATWGLDGTTVGHSNAVTAAGSPGGRYLSFMSERSLAGQDSHDAATEKPVQQVFVYDAASDRLRCASCGFSGGSPHGRVLPGGSALSAVDPLNIWQEKLVSATLPEATATGNDAFFYALYHRRAVLDNGRVFFNSVDSLVPGDSNGQWDVYEFEPVGTGSCTESSKGAGVSRSEGGCVSLISSGTGEEEAAFVDASASGGDVFFTTPAKLSVLDEDTVDDIYDARVDGVVATRPISTECLGEACQPAPNPPNDPTPASAAFSGAGNVASARCPASKRKVTRNGSPRCVAKKHARKHKKRQRPAKRAHHNGRAAR
jgi:hypothetical protein